jgi:hypothetical protein
MRQPGRRGFFFTTDAIIALLVLAVGFAVLFIPKTGLPHQEQVLDYATKTLSLLEGRAVKDLADQNVTMLWCADCQGATHEILYPDNSILEQMADFAIDDKPVQAELLWVRSSGGLVPATFSYNLTLEGPGVARTIALRAFRAADQSDVRLVSNRIVFVRNGTGLEGPFVVRLDIWR